MEGINSSSSLAGTNAKLPPHTFPNERFSSLSTNIINQPLFPSNMNINSTGQPRLIRMESSNPNLNQHIRYQESRQPQQQNAFLNYNQGQRLPQATSLISNNTSAPNVSYQNHEFQRHPAQVERAHLGQQARFSGPMPPMRPLFNDQMSIPRPQVTQVACPPRFPTEQMGLPKDPNSAVNSSLPPEFKMNENVPLQPNNREREVSKNPPVVLRRKSSNPDVSISEEFHNNRQNESESKPRLEIQPEMVSHNQTIQRKEITQQNSHHQPSRQPSVENFLRERENITLNLTQDTKRKETGSLQKQDSTSSISSQNSRGKSAIGKERNKTKIIDEIITCGTVEKNIKFFEDNDTAKTPLIPKTTNTNTEKTKKEKVPHRPDVIKSQVNDGNDYDSGVDETPMIHPDLRSIYQEPRKVAKVSKLKFKNRSKANRGRFKKSFWNSEETKKYEKGSWKSNCIQPSKSYSKKQKIEFSPKEELLAFFHHSKSARLLKRDGNYESDRKDKLASKPTANGDIATPKKTPSKLPGPPKKTPAVSSPSKASLKSPGTPGTPGTKSLPKTPETPSPPTPLIKKVPMNKIQVGSAPSPNLKVVRSKVGSLVNTTHKPGGGNVKIESHKVDFSKAQSRIEAKNDQYARSGGDKKIPQVKLQWSAKSKVGSLENATYKPGGGDKKIETVKLDFKEKAKPKVGSKDNVKHVPGGGTVKIENQKLEFKAQSKVGSLDNVKHKPGGGDVKIFDDKTYLKQISGNGSEERVSGTQDFGDLSVVREVEGKSAPGTPGPKVSVKIKKITTIKTEGTTPTLQNVTEVMVASETHKKGVNRKISSPGHEIKLTYSKLSPSHKNASKESVEIVKVPAKKHAPVLKPSLSKMEAPNIAEKNFSGPITIHQVSGSKEKPLDFHSVDLSQEAKNSESMRHISGSSNLPDGKFNKENDSGMSKFLMEEIAAQKKVGEVWKEMNNLREVEISPQDKVNEQWLQQKLYKHFPILADETSDNNVQLHKSQISSEFQKPSDSQITHPQFKSDLSHPPNFSSYQSSLRTTQLQSNYDVSLIPQSQQLFTQNMAQQSNYERIPITVSQQEARFPFPQQNQSFTSKNQFYEYDTK